MLCNKENVLLDEDHQCTSWTTLGSSCCVSSLIPDIILRDFFTEKKSITYCLVALATLRIQKLPRVHVSVQKLMKSPRYPVRQQCSLAHVGLSLQHGVTASPVNTAHRWPSASPTQKPNPSLCLRVWPVWSSWFSTDVSGQLAPTLSPQPMLSFSRFTARAVVAAVLWLQKALVEECCSKAVCSSR